LKGGFTLAGFGLVTIDGKNYVERWQLFNKKITVTTGLSLQNATLTLPGVANWWLKGLTRETIASNVSAQRRFLFRLGNSDGSTWYNAGGVTGADSRTMDTLMFGDGRFPVPVIPAIFYGENAGILMEIEDLSNSVPYDIYFTFHGSYLIPA
jgi:hypothetical protein